MPSDNEGDMGDLFQDPEGYYPPPPPATCQTHTLQTGQVIDLHLLGHTATEAHRLWNGSRAVSDYFEAEPSRVAGKTVLELGAGAGLPSLVAGLLGARRVVMTDFSDVEIVQNMQRNIDECDKVTVSREAVSSPTYGGIKNRVVALGYVWGYDTAPLLEKLGVEGSTATDPTATGEKFDVLVLADLLFRHAEHGKLVETIQRTMARKAGSRAYVFFTSYRPWLRHKDLAFFDVVREAGLLVDQVVDLRLEQPMFEDDPGDLEIQKTVSGYEVRWPEGQCE